MVTHNGNKKCPDLHATPGEDDEWLGKRHEYGEAARSTMSEIAQEIGFAPTEVSELERVYGAITTLPIGAPASEPDQGIAYQSTGQMSLCPPANIQPQGRADLHRDPIAGSEKGKRQP